MPPYRFRGATSGGPFAVKKDFLRWLKGVSVNQGMRALGRV
jgi:hypothetical protein